jgi:hypothetical protein
LTTCFSQKSGGIAAILRVGAIARAGTPRDHLALIGA